MRHWIYAILIFLVSCGVQKRHYRQGFYVQHHHKGKNPQSSSSAAQKLTASVNKDLRTERQFTKLVIPPDTCDLLTFNDHTSIRVKVIEMTENEIKYHFCDDQTKKLRTARRSSIISIGHGAQPTPPPPPAPVVTPKDTATEFTADTAKTVVAPADTTTKPGKTEKTGCETVIFRDGSEKLVNILEITSTEVRYKNCGEDLPLFRKYKADIFMIKHLDGSKEIFKEEVKAVPAPNTYNQPPEPYVKKSTGLATTANVFAWLGLIPLPFVSLAFSITAIIMGSVYANQADKNPRKYPAGSKARKAIAIGAATAAFGLLMILLAFQ